jgi:phosphotransferase system  glucose/maltose/N-acetylglucosamine-specific IIC component
MQQNGELKELETRMSAILAEANSPDPWTSRARPSFLYVIYVMVLMAIPMGVLSAFRPDMAGAIAAGMQAWLAAIPEDLYVLFGVGYVGYAGARTFEKRKGAVK